MGMTDAQISSALKDALRDHPQFDPTVVDNFISTQLQSTGGQPNAKQQACYDQCETTKQAAIAAALLLGNPIAIALAIAAAVNAFNACRKACDTNAGGS